MSVQGRPEATQHFLLVEVEKPTANLVLFAGGHGKLNLSGGNINWGKNNFLVRSRDKFAAKGFTVAVVDAPSDRQTGNGMYNGFRTSPEHVADIDAVSRKLKEISDVPVWLIGTSRGSESVAWLAYHANEKPAGIVLTSSVTMETDKGSAVTDLRLDRIDVPVLIIAHREDNCWVSPPDGAENIKNALENAPVVKLVYFSGGSADRSKPCQAMSKHGFIGIESDVVDTISTFIRDNS
jgi:pimeloyl-ACP methyl ester carboxylesterase